MAVISSFIVVILWNSQQWLLGVIFVGLESWRTLEPELQSWVTGVFWIFIHIHTIYLFIIGWIICFIYHHHYPSTMTISLLSWWIRRICCLAPAFGGTLPGTSERRDGTGKCRGNVGESVHWKGWSHDSLGQNMEISLEISAWWWLEPWNFEWLSRNSWGRSTSN